MQTVQPWPVPRWSPAGVPAIHHSAFEAVLKEYEEDPKTDTDGEDGYSEEE